MNILFDINHPAHFYLFKNFIIYLKKQAHQIFIISRDKDVTNRLLGHMGWEYISLTKANPGLFGKLKELTIKDIQAIQLHKKQKFDISFGTSPTCAHLTLLKAVPSITFNEDDDGIDPFWETLTYPFTTKIIVPRCLRYRHFKQKRVFHNSYHELAYLHPNNFTADINTLKKYHLEPHRYVILRKSALKATHDIMAKGMIAPLWEKIQDIITGYTVIESHENQKPDIEPWDMHHLLAFAKILISDSQTMTAEAAVLGTPSIRINTFVDKISYLQELEKQYHLTYGFLPQIDPNLIIEKINQILHGKEVTKIWQEKRLKLLKEKIDFNQWMINYFEKEREK